MTLKGKDKCSGAIEIEIKGQFQGSVRHWPHRDYIMSPVCQTKKALLNIEKDPD
jgi:hypothetical protein